MDLETIRSVTNGDVRIVDDNGFHFYRFSTDQEKQYERLHGYFLSKTHSTSGVCMEFYTNTDTIYLDADFFRRIIQKIFLL